MPQGDEHFASTTCNVHAKRSPSKAFCVKGAEDSNLCASEHKTSTYSVNNHDVMNHTACTNLTALASAHYHRWICV